MKKIILYLLISSIYFQLNAQTNIYLKSKTVDYSISPNLTLPNQSNYCFLVFDVIPNSEIKQKIELMDIKFLEYLPRNTFLVNLPKNFNTNRLNEYGVLKILNVLPEYKIDPKIQDGKLPSWAYKNNKLSIKIIFII